MARDAALEAYLAEAASWDRDRARVAQASARRAWWLAGAAGMLATLAIGAVALLTPLKSVEPFVIRVDNATGIVDVVPVYTGTREASELVTRHLLNAYVSARERYVYATAESDYETVGAYQSAQLNQEWLAAWDRNNPQSPLVLFRDGTTVRVQVKAISFLKRANGISDLAQVRFIRFTRAAGAGLEQPSHWIATLQYAYGEPAKDQRQRLMNPLGFKILEYRREPEIVIETAGAAGTVP
jgi:type IV secretion system protein VirB8